ncbi:MAG TPA: tetratricopeptide repeat protein [Blastocatellia bacterium]|nr:tetratricopeptide repeat protein [Blastocatellia bacterium]
MAHKFYLALINLLFLALTAAAQTQPATPEITSLLGKQFFSQPDTKGEVAAAEQKLEADANNLDLLLALGRAQANVWRYQDAIATYTRALQNAPINALLYRHRGHRYITIRDYAKAVSDLERAARLNDQDFDIWYHLGLAYYLKGDFEMAIKAYLRCRAVAVKEAKDDSIVAVSDWLYMSYRRAGKKDEAAKVLERIKPDMNVKENKSYFDRLLFYKGLKKEAEIFNVDKATDLEIATVGYGLGNWYLYNGKRDQALEYFRKITAGKYWPAFGFIAAETELARLGR